MSQQMKAAVMKGIRKVEIENLPVPVPKEDEVLVRIKSVGVCGSDIHYFIEGRIGDYIVEPPFILGHECSGEVVEIGAGVKDLKPGDRVTMEPGIPCGKCENCRVGRYNLCPDVIFWATPPIDGSFCEYVTHPACFTYPIADQVSFEEAALVEPLSVGMYATRRARVEPGQTALVLGSGTIGLVTIEALLARGLTKVIAVDVVDMRLQKAKELGAFYTINPQKEDVVKTVKDLTGNKGVHVVFETAGSVATTQMTVEVAKRGGKVVLIGLPSQAEFNFNIIKTIDKELDVLGIFRYANAYPGGVDLLNSGRVNLKSLITHRFPLEKAQEALLFAHEHKAESIKVVVNL
ncbi:MAG: NAD(P)-dependent alcohol dehydrogenase [Atribacterota bacterium]|jgi:L-iditol 2-dehydrogenase|uniref:Sorbitol dehydrogenase n=1 Tax=Candidatus Atribacter allofermentans TaxID=1852833 RepID=A0A1V5SRS6_9BACT|nr:NAD(P)-dependent alcohol dehydrogenase [Atribacterota bacterium]OQA57246.1 MAG: Sorbitol dehydrogenase [Candidatus Atribacteria bacterium ADurb.Bin276]